jgi:lipopolysaccharide heptosyltransferase II
MGKPIEKSKIHKILIRATNWVGDAVMTMPALEAVRKNFQDADITVLARPWVTPLLEAHPAVNRVIPYRRGNGFGEDFLEILRIVRRIREQDFDLAILFQNAFEAALLAFLGGIKNRVGYSTDGRGFLLSHGVRRRDDIMKGHQVEYYLGILKGMGWEADSKDPILFVDPDEDEKIGIMLRNHGIEVNDFLMALSPGAIYGPAKRWPSERFALIGDWAVEKWGAKVLIMGSEREKDIGADVNDAMKHPALNLCGLTSLGGAMALIKRCGFFVTNDSGLMHVAAALHIPLVAVFGSTDPVATGPRGPNARIVQHETDCAPCLKPECPEDSRCMLSITSEEVWQEMEELKRRDCLNETGSVLRP